jgi:PAS domain S-box-containing protein
MTKTLRILLVEDNEDDAGMVNHLLKKSNLVFTMKIVSTKPDFNKFLEEYWPDIIISDHSLPNFSSLEALRLTKKKNPMLPFILVTGTVSEEFAAEIIREGADDYILKGNMKRLPTAVENALNQKRIENERNIAIELLRKSEEHFRKLIENSSDIFAIISMGKTVGYISPSSYKTLGYKPKELVGKDLFDFIHEEDKTSAIQMFLMNSRGSDLAKTEFRFLHKNGSWHYLECLSKPDSLGDNTIVNIRDITERKIAEEELKRKNKELEKINSELDSFVYSASHDLRAPLKSILGLVKLSQIECQQRIFDSFETYMNLMEKSVYKLDETIQEIVYYSGNARSVIIKETIDLREVVDNAFSKVKYIEGNDKIHKDIVIEGETPLFSDKNRLNVIFNNLISNAIKYHNPQQEAPFIKIYAKIDSPKTTIICEDNGIGIADKYKMRIFDMFFRATEKSDGSGLGLYIIKEMVQKLGGDIQVESKLGIGTTFKIEITNEQV